MALSDDRLSKPRAGRYFPYAADEFSLRVREFSFAVFHHEPPNKRVAIYLQNCDVECPLGYQLCSFYRRVYIAQLSLPISVPTPIARKAIDVSLAQFRDIDAGPDLSLRNEQFVVYRAYLRSLWTLTVAQHVVNAGNHWYLHYRAASRLSKAQNNPNTQHVLFKAEVA